MKEESKLNQSVIFQNQQELPIKFHMVQLIIMKRILQKLELFITPVPIKTDLHLMNHQGLTLAYFQIFLKF